MDRDELFRSDLRLWANLGRPAFSFTIVNGIDHTSVVPVLDNIVWTIVNLYVYGISSIVDEEDDGPLPTFNHC